MKPRVHRKVAPKVRQLGPGSAGGYGFCWDFTIKIWENN